LLPSVLPSFCPPSFSSSFFASSLPLLCHASFCTLSSFSPVLVRPSARPPPLTTIRYSTSAATVLIGRLRTSRISC
jgi:hypothetical protein